jgi:molybdopterin/thiamine biosynthesis adenylyltransferase
MIRVVFARRDYDALRGHLLEDLSKEQAAFMPAGYVIEGEEVVLLVRGVVPVPPSGFLAQSGGYLEVSPEFLAPIVKQCREEGLALIDAHTHPFSRGATSFSGIDDRGDARLIPKVLARLRAPFYGSLVFSQARVDGRIVQRDAAGMRPIDSIRVVRTPLEDLPTVSGLGPRIGDLAEMQHRQILAIGEVAQRRLAGLHVGVVGVGGIGSQVVQQLAHLGVGFIVVCDPQRVEESNRSRIVGSEPEDVVECRPKVDVMKRLVSRVNLAATVVPLPYTVDDPRAWSALRSLDVIFSCTDTTNSRDFLTKFASRYLIPLIDTGTEVEVTGIGKIRNAAGRVTVMLPGEGCLHGAGVLRGPDQATDGAYGTPFPDPAVISLNGVVASMAVTGLLTLVTGFEREKPENVNLEYRVLQARVQHTTFPGPACDACRALYGQGDVGLSDLSGISGR